MITFSRALIKLTPKTSHYHNSLGPLIDPSISITKLLDLSIQTHSLKLSQQAHAVAHRLGLVQHPIIAQKLIFSCCQFKHPFDARLVFDSILVKNAHICNTLLSGYGKNQFLVESLELFREMCGGLLPVADEFTFSVVFKVVGGFGEVLCGRVVHGRSVKNGFVLDTVVGNSLMSMYGRCGCFEDSLKIFDEMPERSVSSWNALISGYAKTDVESGSTGLCRYRLWDIVKGMQDEGLRFDAFTVSTLLSLCSGGGGSDDCIKNCFQGRELHSYIIRQGVDSSSGLNSDFHLGSCLIDMYSKNGKVDVGRRVFDRLNHKNVFAWTAMINGYVHCGDFDEALRLFRVMQWIDGVGPNKVSLVAILPACSSIAGLIGGKQIHGFAVRRELNHELNLCNALIDMYSKCGSLNYAARVFEHECIYKDAISWSSIICGYGLHGQGQDAVLLFDKMLQNGIKPDSAVVVGVLSACCRSGLINDGMRIYNSVLTNYNIEPTIEMCGCVVDMLSRSGKFNRALDFIKRMPVEPGPTIWGPLLCASSLQGNSEIQELAYEALIRIEPDNSSNYISFSNLHAAKKRWDVVAEVRKVIRERGLKKSPGCSWISINSATHSFFVADKSHPRSELIYGMLNELVSTMKLTCYNPDFAYLMEVE